MNSDVALREEGMESGIRGFEMRPRNLEEAMNFAKMLSESDIVPNSYKGKPGNIICAIQLGSELGLTPMRALRSIAVINGRASLWGDDLLAMVLASPVCEYVNESESTDKAGVCRLKRKNCIEQVSTFTLEDAKRAGLLGKQGPWQTNTSRMLKLRARGFGLRDTFADVLAGLVSVEEALDLPATDPAVVPEAPHLTSLKDKLKAKVGIIDVQREQAVDQPSDREALAVALPSATDVSTDASAPEDPAEPYRARLRTAHDSKEAMDLYNGIPETIRQDCFAAYSDKLKSFNKKKP